MTVFSDPQKNLEQFDIMPGMKVADFGSGIGYYTFPLARMVGSSGQVFALDIHRELLVTLKREAEKAHLFNIHVVTTDFDGQIGTKLKDDFIERGIVANVLFQIENKDKFVKEIGRVLRKGGKILVVDWTDSFGGIGPEASAILKKDECRKLFESNGFSFERNISAGTHHYGFVFVRM